MISRSALILTASNPEFWPGQGAWGRIASALEGERDRVHIFGLLPTFGVLPESCLRSGSAYLKQGQIKDEEISALEAAAKIRTWLDLEAPAYGAIVYVPGEPVATRAWNMAVPGSRMAKKIRVERPVRDKQGLSGLFFHERLRRRLLGGT